MPAVARLLTICDLDPVDPDPRPLSGAVRAVLLAVLDDGRRVTLLDDRGWGSSQLVFWRYAHPGEPPLPRDQAGRLAEALEEMRFTARAVVGPDDDGPAAEAGHWSALANRLRATGVEVGPGGLGALRHDVELTAALLTRVRADLQALQSQG